MAKIHDLFIIELAEVIKGYGNDPDVEDPFRLSEFYRFYELPNIAVSRENFEKMRPAQPDPRYTEEELRVFQHGISLSLLSKRWLSIGDMMKTRLQKLSFLNGFMIRSAQI